MKRTIPYATNSREILQHIVADKPVRVYRNLHKNCISVKQLGLVRCHADNVVMQNCKFIVSKAGQQRVRNEKRKNVHAYIEGIVVDARSTDVLLPFAWDEIYYDPYKTDFWTVLHGGQEVEGAEWIDLDGKPCPYRGGPSVIGFNLKMRQPVAV